jgi:hypothetical protein
MAEPKKTDKAKAPAGKFVAVRGIDYDPSNLRIEAGEVADELPESVLKTLARSGDVTKTGG